MKSPIYLFIVSLFLLYPFDSQGQRAKRKNVKAQLTHYPVLDIGTINSYTIKIYPGSNQIDQDDLKEKKGIGSKLQAFQDKVNKAGGPEFYTYKEFQSLASGADALVEIAFGDFRIRNKEEVEWKIPCTYEGAELKKENIMECPAYYYALTYELPVILKISDASGNILYAEQWNSQRSSDFGKSELAGFLKRDDLATAYGQPGVMESLGKEAMVNRLEELAIPINTCFYYYDESLKLEVATGTGSFDYPELDKAQALAATAYSTTPLDEAQLNGAIEIWEKALMELDKEDKKARVGRNLGMGLYENLAVAYSAMNNNEKAMESIDLAIEMQQLMANKTREESLYAMKRNIMANRSSGNSIEANKKAMTGSRITAGLILTEARVKSKDAGYTYLASGKPYSAFEADYQKYSGQGQQEESAMASSEGMTLGEMLGGNKSYKERIMVLGANKQLILNDAWGDDLDALPEEICQLNELTQLNLTNQSKVTTLPSCIGELSNLKKLNLWENSLTSLPAEIGNLSALEVLDVSNNQLTELPLELKNCKSLKKLVIKGNSISNLDEITSAFPKLKVK